MCSIYRYQISVYLLDKVVGNFGMPRIQRSWGVLCALTATKGQVVLAKIATFFEEEGTTNIFLTLFTSWGKQSDSEVLLWTVLLHMGWLGWET